MRAAEPQCRHSTHHANGQEGMMAAPKAKGSMFMASILQEDHRVALGGGRHFFSTTILAQEEL